MTTIAVALDGSASSSSILLAALPLARAWKASLGLVSVVDRPDVPPERRPWLERLTAELAAEGLTATFQLRIGSPAEEILAYLDETRPDLLAMATHGRRGMERLRLGSVAEEVLRRAEAPVLVARPETAGTRGRALLVALDGSPLAEEILPDVVRLAKATERRVELVRASLAAVTAGGLGEYPMYFPQDDPLPYLKDVAARLAAQGVTAVPVALAGRAAAALPAYAEAAGAGLIALTTHGRTGVRRALLGSIAEEMLRQAPCPVLVRRTSGAPVVSQRER
jgi:nucleotide-binding universal stress UspA family protein